MTLDASTTAIDATAAMPQHPRIVVGNAALSFVGEPFQHDVFVSYAHAERETDETLIRDWSQKLADRLRTLLASALNPTLSDGSSFDLFLDDRSSPRRRPDRDLRDRAERSAILLVLMSPLYPRKTGASTSCTGSLRAAQDGRGREHCLPVRIQPLPDAAWPQRLKDERGRAPRLYRFRRRGDRPAAGRSRHPAGQGPCPQGSDPDQGPAGGPAAAARARRAFDSEFSLTGTGLPPRPPQDREAWQAAVALLDPSRSCCPDELPTPAADDALLQRQRESRLSRACASAPPCSSCAPATARPSAPS